jgi:hypothetical protein
MHQVFPSPGRETIFTVVFDLNPTNAMLMLIVITWWTMAYEGGRPTFI